MSIYNNANVTLGDSCNYKDLFINNSSSSIKLAGFGTKCYINTNTTVDIKGSIKYCYILNSGVTVEKPINSLKLINSNNITIDDNLKSSYDINNCSNMKFVNA